MLLTGFSLVLCSRRVEEGGDERVEQEEEGGVGRRGREEEEEEEDLQGRVNRAIRTAYSVYPSLCGVCMRV